MTDLAAELTAKLVKPNSFTMGSAPFHVIELAAFVYANAPTILAGLAAMEERDKLREALREITKTVCVRSPLSCKAVNIAAAALQPTPETKGSTNADAK